MAEDPINDREVIGKSGVEYEIFPISSCKFFRGFRLPPEQAAEGILSGKKVWEMENGDSKEQ